MSQVKRIMIITNNFPYGGADANLLRYFSYSLYEKGNNIKVVMPTGASYGNRLYQSVTRRGVFNGIEYLRLGYINHPGSFLGKLNDNLLGIILPFLYLFLKCVQRVKPDKVIVYHPSFLSMLSVLLSKYLLNIDLTVILPEFYEKPDKKYRISALVTYYNFFWGIKYLVKHSDRFIVLSNYLYRLIESKVKKKKPVLLMPNLIDIDNFLVSEREYKEDYCTIGYVGTPTRKDGVLDLISSFVRINKLYPKTHLIIIGDLTNGKSVVPSLMKHAHDCGCKSDSITFTGLVQHSLVPSLLNSCQILALTRPNGVFAEAGFPTKLGEYFACKKPVVITRVGDIGYYFRDREHVVMAQPENIASIVHAFEYLLCNPQEHMRIGNNGYSWMMSNLYYKNQSQRINSFLFDENVQ